MNKDFRERIYRANVEVYRYEAKHYDLIHPELNCGFEQRRLRSTLKLVDKLVSNNQRTALDFGPGTGNLTAKLLQLDYSVTAVDISSDMCNILRKRFASYINAGKLRIINKPVDSVDFGGVKFDLIACYSVLHHLPDYIDEISRLTDLLKAGGVMYLDHEVTPFYWMRQSSRLSRLCKHGWDYSNSQINRFHSRVFSSNIPSVNHLKYDSSDYWGFQEHHIDHGKIGRVFEEKKFEFFMRVDYHVHRTWLYNPFFSVYRFACKPDMCYWVGRK